MDHVNPEKFEFRKKMLGFDGRKRKILELYAGVGYLSAGVYVRAYGEVVMVEKNAAHFRRLVRRVGRFAGAYYYHKDNADFIREDLGEHADFTAVDMDAWGTPMATAALFFEKIAPGRGEPFLLLLTDGALLPARRRVAVAWWQYYGLGPDYPAPFPRRWGDDFEGYQSAAVDQLADRYGWDARVVGRRRNHNHTALYSAYVLTRRPI